MKSDAELVRERVARAVALDPTLLERANALCVEAPSLPATTLLADLRMRARLVGRNRRLRSLLVDVLWYLEHPGDPSRELTRRARLAERIRDATAE
jgi:hypothetical protein